MYKTCYGPQPHVHLPTAAVEIKLDSAKSVVSPICITGSNSLSMFIVTNQIKKIQY